MEYLVSPNKATSKPTRMFTSNNKQQTVHQSNKTDITRRNVNKM